MKTISVLTVNAFLLAVVNMSFPDVRAADALPNAMQGSWLVDNPSARRAGGGDWSIRIDKIAADGSFEEKSALTARTVTEMICR
jgi:hypothetical protein